MPLARVFSGYLYKCCGDMGHRYELVSNLTYHVLVFSCDCQQYNLILLLIEIDFIEFFHHLIANQIQLTTIMRINFYLLKTLCLVGFWGTASSYTQAQAIIPDRNFAAAIRSVCPTCIDSINTLLAPAKMLRSLDVNGKNITDLTGIAGFNNLQVLNCSSNNLVTLPTLPNNLINLDCSYNQLISLPALPNTLTVLRCPNNKLATLSTLPNSLKELYCNENQLTSLTILPNTLTYLDCSYNQLITLPTLPNNLTTLYCYVNKLTSLPALSNNLTDLACFINQLTSLPTLPNSLTFLSCSNNQINFLPILPNTITSLSCEILYPKIFIKDWL